jgi:5-methylcytosine-specific restriction enzyme A
VPSKGLRACPEPGCPNLTTGGRCSVHLHHTPNPWQPFYETSQWRKMSAKVRAEERACRGCGATENLEVDHRVSLSDGGPRLDRANLQVLCRSCHEHKTHLDRHKREREGRRYLTPSG